MSEYTPTTDDVKWDYQALAELAGKPYSQSGPEFDRWLAAHDAYVARSAVESLMTAGVTFDPDRGVHDFFEPWSRALSSKLDHDLGGA